MPVNTIHVGTMTLPLLRVGRLAVWPLQKSGKNQLSRPMPPRARPAATPAARRCGSRRTGRLFCHVASPLPVAAAGGGLQLSSAVCGGLLLTAAGGGCLRLLTATIWGSA